MSLTRDEVAKVASLARLQFDDADLDLMTQQLGSIVEYINLLEEVDVEGVQPMAHAVEVSNVFRADEVKSSLPREQALANAPHADGEFYLVPAVLGEA